MLDRVLDEQKQETEGDHDIFSHIVVPASAVTEAYINGTQVTALCGKTWVPSRNPDRHQVCPTCKEILEMAKAAKG
jgi:hypothetical protein